MSDNRLHCYRGVRLSFRFLRNVFKPDMLAFLLLTSKRERELCGALAWGLLRFYKRNPPYELVTCEWSYPGTRRACDLAILSDDGSPNLLIEAKAAYTFDLMGSGRFPAESILLDIARLREFKFDGERYVLVFFTHPKRKPDRKFRSVVKYYDDLSDGTRTDQLEEGFDRFHAAIGNLPILDEGRIPAGNAFGVEVDVLYWLFQA